MVTVGIEFKSLDSIKAACKRLGWEFVQGQQTYRWVGTWVDDTPTPRHLFATEEEYLKVCAMNRHDRTAVMQSLLGKCAHAIKIPGAKGEIGLIERAGQFIPIWDYFTSGLYEFRAENGIKGFAQSYAVEEARRVARLQGNFCTEEQEQDGTIKLHVNIPEY